MTGRAKATAAGPVGLVAWAPEDLPISADTDPTDWWYVVLEELVDAVALLRGWPWPSADPFGRLVWTARAEQDTTAATVDAGLLRAQLYTLNDMQRVPRVGDVFAAHGVLGPRWRSRRVDGRVRDVRDLFGDATVYDITADAREAAKIAYQGSLGAVAPAAATPRPTRELAAATLRARAEQHLPRLQIAAPPVAPPAAASARRRSPRGGGR